MEHQQPVVHRWIEDFITNYMEGYWINGPHALSVWNVYNDDPAYLTNNAAEGIGVA